MEDDATSLYVVECEILMQGLGPLEVIVPAPPRL